jgi:hypothetical protein
VLKTFLLNANKVFVENGLEWHYKLQYIISAENTKGGRITVPFTSCLTGLD